MRRRCQWRCGSGSPTSCRRAHPSSVPSVRPVPPPDGPHGHHQAFRCSRAMPYGFPSPAETIDVLCSEKAASHDRWMTTRHRGRRGGCRPWHRCPACGVVGRPDADPLRADLRDRLGHAGRRRAGLRTRQRHDGRVGRPSRSRHTRMARVGRTSRRRGLRAGHALLLGIGVPDTGVDRAPRARLRDRHAASPSSTATPTDKYGLRDATATTTRRPSGAGRTWART
jgi:hypothetical protein